MRFRLTWAGAAAILAAALLPLKAGGCTPKTACIHAVKGACPSMGDANGFFTKGCGSQVQSVDGEGTFDGEFCCYPVTEFPDNGGDFACFEGAGGAGGFRDTGGFGGFGAANPVGGAGGSVMCSSCAQQLSGPAEPIDLLCPGSDAAWSSLVDCGCGICLDECTPTVCNNISPDDACTMCLTLNCSAELDSCMNE